MLDSSILKMHTIIQQINKMQANKQWPQFSAGDTIAVTTTIKEEKNKVRKQVFAGVVIKRQGTGASAAVVVRKNFKNIFVERLFRIYSPYISDIKILKKGRVRRARIYYLRQLRGKSARIQQIF